MKDIIKVLLQEGIDEEVIHEVLNVLEVSKDWIEPRLIKGTEKQEELDTKKEEVLNNPKATEEEKDLAVKKSAEYNCKNINTTNKTYNYLNKKRKSK